MIWIHFTHFAHFCSLNSVFFLTRLSAIGFWRKFILWNRNHICTAVSEITRFMKYKRFIIKFRSKHCIIEGWWKRACSWYITNRVEFKLQVKQYKNNFSRRVCRMEKRAEYCQLLQTTYHTARHQFIPSHLRSDWCELCECGFHDFTQLTEKKNAKKAPDQRHYLKRYIIYVK